jgi:hypothetical protein
MLAAAFLLLSIAVLLGCVLAVLDMRGGAATPLWWLGAPHGLAALSGLACLVLALRGPVRGLDQGTASFGALSAWLLAAAALMGVSLLGARLRRRRLPGFQIGLHATLAVSGFVVLAAYFFA